MNQEMQSAYLNGRSELGRHCLNLLQDIPDGEHILSHVFWENAWCDSGGAVHELFHPLRPGRMNVQSFDAEKAPSMESVDGYRRLRVTENWCLDMKKYGSFETWFQSVARTRRKTLRWLDNTMARENIRIIPVDSEETYGFFESMYAAQFPKYPIGSSANTGVKKIYRELCACGHSYSHIMLDGSGTPAAACLGYINGNSFNFTHLTRRTGVLDKFSPGLYLAYAVIRKLFEERKDVEFFFMGPGRYDYKPAFLAEPLPVYRYEKDSWLNIRGLLRMYSRLCKERRKYLRNSS